MHFISTASSKTALNKDRLEALWKLFFVESFHELQSKLLFDILLKETTYKASVYSSSSVKLLGFSTSKDQAINFFRKFICTSLEIVPIKNLTIRFFDCYKKYYECSIFREPSYNSNEPIAELAPELKTAWQLALNNNTNLSLLNASQEWIVDVFVKCLKVNGTSSKEKLAIVEQFLERTLGSANSENLDECKATFSIIKLFIKKAEQTEWETSLDHTLYDCPPLAQFSVKPSFGKKEQLAVVINENLSLPHLKNKLSYLFKVPKERIKLTKESEGWQSYSSSINWDYYKTDSLAAISSKL